MLALAAIWLAASPPELAAGQQYSEGSPTFDLACTYAAQVIVNGMDAKDAQHEPIQAMASFYFGRVDLALSAEKVEEASNAVAAEFDGKDLQPFYERCRVFFGNRGKAWTDLSLRMKAKEQAQGQ